MLVACHRSRGCSPSLPPPTSPRGCNRRRQRPILPTTLRARGACPRKENSEETTRIGSRYSRHHGCQQNRPLLPRDEWTITVVDPDETHYYQPGYLFIPFGYYRPDEVVKPKKRYIPSGVEFVVAEVDKVEPDQNKVVLTDGTELPHDYLIIASGTTPRPDQTPGMDGDEFRKSVHEFYTYDGAVALAEKLRTWEGGVRRPSL